jgi:WS/DGAT/MGAT family acyltransferase
MTPRSLLGTAGLLAGINLGAALGTAVGLVNANRQRGTNIGIPIGTDLGLALAGARLRVRGAHNLRRARPAVFVVNHQSALDPIVAAGLVRRDFTVVGKKEARYSLRVALLNLALRPAFVDRANTEQAKASLDAAVRRISAGTSIIVAPGRHPYSDVGGGAVQEGRLSHGAAGGCAYRADRHPQRRRTDAAAIRDRQPGHPRHLRAGPDRHHGLDTVVVGRARDPGTTAVRRHPGELARRWRTAMNGAERLESWGTAPVMNELETLMWRSERHPQLSSTAMFLAVLDTVPDWDRLSDAHQWAVRRIPRLCDRVLEPAMPVGPPAWVPDKNFALSYHLRRTRLAAPGSMSDLLAVAQTLALTPFDRTRPLWEGTLIEGLDGDRAAYVLKMHHSLTDGMGAVQLLTLLHSKHPEHTQHEPVAACSESTADVDGFQLAAAEIAAGARQLPGALRQLTARGARVLGDPGSAVAAAARFTGSVRRTAARPAEPSPLLRRRAGRDWRFGVFECPLPDLKAAAKAADGTVNDGYIAVLLGGLRRYHEHFGFQPHDLPMAMPVSLRKADDPLGGNKFAGGLLAGPVGTADPAKRIATIHERVQLLRNEPALESFSWAAPLLNRLPAAAGAAVLGHVGSIADLSASTVPGLNYPTYVAGARIERMYPLPPLPGVAVMAGMLSHDGVCCFGLNMDGAAVLDPDFLIDCMRSSVDEVCSLAA